MMRAFAALGVLFVASAVMAAQTAGKPQPMRGVSEGQAMIKFMQYCHDTEARVEEAAPLLEGLRARKQAKQLDATLSKQFFAQHIPAWIVKQEDASRNFVVGYDAAAKSCTLILPPPADTEAAQMQFDALVKGMIATRAEDTGRPILQFEIVSGAANERAYEVRLANGTPLYIFGLEVEPQNKAARYSYRRLADHPYALLRKAAS